MVIIIGMYFLTLTPTLLHTIELETQLEKSHQLWPSSFPFRHLCGHRPLLSLSLVYMLVCLHSCIGMISKRQLSRVWQVQNFLFTAPLILYFQGNIIYTPSPSPPHPVFGPEGTFQGGGGVYILKPPQGAGKSFICPPSFIRHH